jgi:ferritin-like metal-binding protein YciE
MPTTSLGDLYLQQLQLLRDAEKQGLDAMPHLAQLVRDTKLCDTLQTHRRQSQEHLRRLERLIGSRGQPARSGECVSMRALIEEALDTLATIEDPDTIDAFVIGAQQAIEHHEIAAYGTARSWARQLGFDEDANVLQQTLDEEGAADELLSTIAEGRVNERASQGAEREVEIARGGQADRSRIGSDELGQGAGRLLDVDAKRGADMR